MNLTVFRPVITEKTMTLAGRQWFTFAVDPDLSKRQIAANIESLYKVEVIDVRTISMHGKSKRVGRKMNRIQTPNWKKAMVQLKAGQKIDAFEITTEEKTK